MTQALCNFFQVIDELKKQTNDVAEIDRYVALLHEEVLITTQINGGGHLGFHDIIVKSV